jgi:hypothetical protein
MADTSDVGVSPQSVDLFSSKSGFQCAPSPLGNGTWPRLRSNAAGTVAWWYCPGSSGEWYLNFAAATAANLSASKLWDDIYAVITASDPVAAFHAAVAKRVTASMSDPSLKPVWQPFLAEMLSGAPAVVGKQGAAVVQEAGPGQDS